MAQSALNRVQNYRYLVLLLFCLLFSVKELKAQTVAEKYDLGFKVVNNCNWSWLYYSTHCKFAKQNTDPRKPMVSIFYDKEGWGNSTQFMLSKTIIFPKNHKGKVEVAITTKSEMANPMQLIAKGIDKEGNETVSDSIAINNKTWKKNTVSFMQGENRAVRISLKYNGGSQQSQQIWLGNIRLKLGGKDISNDDYFSENKDDSTKTINSLDKNRIVPLSMDNDSTILSNITGLEHKKIFGLGECTHGSMTLKASRYQFLKNLILNQNCKLIALETPIDMVMLWDLYIQGKIDDSYKQVIEEDLKGVFDDHKLSIEFIAWLRAYNSKATSKVHLVGMDDVAMTQLHLFDYHLALLGKQKGFYYLKKIQEEKYEELAAYAESDTLIKKLLGKQEFSFYLAFLKTKLGPTAKSPAIFSRDRDLSMSTRISQILNIYTGETESAAILAHSMHLGSLKFADFLPPQDTPLGFYLRQKYGNQFFPISFQIGKGTYTQDECQIVGANMVETLPAPSKQSFEYAALMTGLEYFYYPAGYLGDDILSSCKILRGSRYRDVYRFSNVRKEFDAYVFIRESKALENVEKYPIFYASDHLGKKYRTMTAFFKDLKN